VRAAAGMGRRPVVLLDLALECASQTPQETAPLRADRVWILDSGGAKLVDDPTADRAARAGRGPEASCAALLFDVARTARGSSVDPWPLGAQRFLDGLRAEPPPGPSSIVRELESLSTAFRNYGDVFDAAVMRLSDRQVSPGARADRVA
jgi:hypothetical protein